MQSYSADEYYRNAPPEQWELLRSFRLTHPYQHLQVEGVEWEYVASGQGDQAVLVLGGGLATGESSYRTILHLENRYRVLSPTYPPVGKMPPIAAGLSAILAKEGYTKAHVFGHSLGAGVGHVFVRMCPERIDRLILDGFGLYTRGHTLTAKLFFKLPYPWLVNYYRRAMKRLAAGASGDEQIFLAMYTEELITCLHTRQTLMGQFNLLFDIFDQARAYGTFKPVERPGKTLLMLAEDDRGFSPAERRALKNSYPDALVHTYPAGGHLSAFTRRAEFEETIDSFIGG